MSGPPSCPHSSTGHPLHRPEWALLYEQLEHVEEPGEPVRSLPDPIQEARPDDHARLVARDAEA